MTDTDTELSTIPTTALLAEIDRRTIAAAPPKVLFYGVWPGSGAGHYVRLPHGQTLYDIEREIGEARPGGLYPWLYYGGVPQPEPQTEGKIWHWHHPTKPMTLLLSWDRSEDRRGGCVSTFIVLGHVTAERGLELARAAFPRVFERVEAHMGRAVELAGPAPVAGR